MKFHHCLLFIILSINEALGINADIKHYNFYIDGAHFTEIVYYLPTSGLKCTYYPTAAV